MSKQYLSWIDIGISAPQPEQHLIIRNFAKRYQGKITFSDSEDIKNRFNQNFLLSRLIELPKVDGVVLFTEKKFYLKKKLNYNLLKKIVNNNFGIILGTILFNKENIS